MPLDSVLITPELLDAQQRLDYTLRHGTICLVTGEVGAGKSAALRWSCGQLHSPRYNTLWFTAPAGSILEVYRQLLVELDLATVASSRAVLNRLIRSRIDALVSSQKKQQPPVVIDEASLLCFDVFAELHTITQFDGDSKPWLLMVLPGQNNLAENLLYRPPSHWHPASLLAVIYRQSIGRAYLTTSTIVDSHRNIQIIIDH